MTTATATTYTQATRRMAIATPLGEDALLLVGFNGTEELSRLFNFELDLASLRDDIGPDEIVGKNITIGFELLDGSHRFLNGYVSRFTYRGTDDRLSHYSAEMVPALWFLSRRTDCRIFQKKTVVQIIEEVFEKLNFKDFESAEIKGSHPEREYCVQYRESDFDFISRLMEEEGIFYFFRHENGKHVLVLADHNGVYKDCPENEVEFGSPTNAPDMGELITSWEHKYEFRSGKYTHTDYNFETPTAPMLATTPTMVKLGGVDKYELFDYPGRYTVKADGEANSKVRMEEHEVPFDVVLAGGKCRTFFAGGMFTLARHHAEAETGKKYVITSVTHSAMGGTGYETGGTDAPLEYSNSFTCIPASVKFRPASTTPKPIVHGSQTAVVVGPSGEEIHADKYGRVKVQFHWDRYNKADENSSCWIRVAQLWAGKQWGAMFLPRVGQEVVVDFLEGDPDRPLIVGRVYHAESMPPYNPEEFKTMSTIKTLSSPDGGGFNELRFEDKKGEEQIFIHAENEYHTRVKKNAFEYIGENRHLIVAADQYEQVDGDKHLTVTGDQNEKVDGTVSLKVASDLQQKIGANHALEAGQEIHLKGGMKVILEAGTQLTLKVGGNFVDINPGGVFISGTMVMVNSGGSAGSGSGCSPDAAKAPEEAMDAEPGEVNVPPEAPEPPEPVEFSPAAAVLQEAAENGTPFCEQCERARQEQMANA